MSEELLAKITRSAKDENGNVYQIPGNMTYREWEKGRNEGKINSWIKQTGGYTREETFAEREERREKEADKEYDLIRKQDDIAAIATHTGFSAEEILQIKNHVFFDNHVLYDGEIGRCFPSYDMAVAWQRLARGEGIDRDILLLRHELLEDQYEKQYNSDLEAAHHYSDSVYGWYDRMRAETNGEGEPDGLLHFSRKKQ